MKLELRPRSKAIVAKTKEKGIPLSARDILGKPLPHPKWWGIVSRSAKSSEPYYSATPELAALNAADPGYPPWPEGLYEEEDSLPGITQSEALGLLDRFLRAERGKLVAGVQMYPLHWDLLAAHYCPLRARFTVIKEVVALGLLVESAGTELHQQSGLRWPLTITEDGRRAVTRAGFDARLPTLRRIEDWLQQLSLSYPLVTKAIFWVIIGGGGAMIIDWLIQLLTNGGGP
jgi:hypothetical protein